MPLDEMLPPLADQVTPVLVVPLTEAANCWLAPSANVVEVGEILMLMFWVAVVVAADTINGRPFDFVLFCGFSMVTVSELAWAMSVL